MSYLDADRRARLTFIVNLVPRLSSAHSSLGEETLVNAGHMAPRFWKPLGYILLRRGGSYVIWVNVTRVTLVINRKRLELHALTSTTHFLPKSHISGS